MHEVLSTVAMFGGGQRLAVVEDADDFVTRYRAAIGRLRRQAEPQRRAGARPGFAAEQHAAVQVDRRRRAADRLRRPAPGAADQVACRLGQAAPPRQLSPSAADMLVELIGPELGLLDQELAKLALVAGDDRKITPELVGSSVGGWRTKTTWDMLDAAMDGHVARGHAATRPPAGLGRAAGRACWGRFRPRCAGLPPPRDWCFKPRRPAAAPTSARPWSRRASSSFVLQKAERQLRLLGRQRGAQLYRWLLQADLDLKGESTMPPRLILERLIVRLAAPPEPAGKR